MVFGTPRRFYKKFKFVVEIDGVGSAGFNKAGPLSASVGVVSYREGGALAATEDPGLYNSEDITLERGATDDQDLFAWFKEVVDAANNSGTGLNVPEFKRNLEIVQQDRSGISLARWRVFEAWPNTFVGGDWDNEAEENVMESVVLTNKFFDRIL